MTVRHYCIAIGLACLTSGAAHAQASAPQPQVAAAGPNLPVRPKGDPRSWVPFDVLLGAAKGQAVAATQYDMIVDAEGRVTDCLVAVSAGNSRVEATVCAQFRSKVRFLPATDAAARAIPGKYRFKLGAIPAGGY